MACQGFVQGFIVLTQKDIRFLPTIMGGCLNNGTIVLYLDDDSYFSEVCN
jgi:hypothetical protein